MTTSRTAFAKYLAPALRPLAAFALVGSIASASAAPGTTSLDVIAGFNYDNNVNRTERDQRREGDGIFNLGAKGAYRYQVSERSGIVAAVDAGVDLHTDFGDLDALRAKASLSYVIQPFAGFAQPWFALTAGYQLQEFAASDIRDGNETSLGIEAGQRFTDRIAARIGYTISDRDSSKSRAFEQHQKRFHVVGDYTLTSRINLYTKYDYVRGGVTTTAPRNPRLRGNFRTFAADRVFGRNVFAWRLDGERHQWRLGSKYRLAKQTVLDLSFGHSLTEAGGDNQWNVWNGGLSVSHRY